MWLCLGTPSLAYSTQLASIWWRMLRGAARACLKNLVFAGWEAICLRLADLIYDDTSFYTHRLLYDNISFKSTSLSVPWGHLAIENARSSRSKHTPANSFLLEDLELTCRRWIALEARAATGAVGRCLSRRSALGMAIEIGKRMEHHVKMIYV